MSRPTPTINHKRRSLLLALAGGSLPLRLPAASRQRIVIIGAGVAGLCSYQILKKQLPADRFELLIIEPQAGYTPPFCEQAAFVPGRLTKDHLPHYQPYPESIALDQILDKLVRINTEQRRLSLQSGTQLAYDYLIVAPGLEAVTELPGNDCLGWFNDNSLLRLLHALDGLNDHSEIVLGVAQLPYRCSPAPYQRASLMHAYLEALGHKHTHITIVDDKNRFALQAHFLKYWENHCAGAIEWLAADIHEGIHGYSSRQIETGFGAFEGDFVLGIPNQHAPHWCADAGLSDFTGFCPIYWPSMRSQRHENIYVLGDAAKAEPMPKAASAAAKQAQSACIDLLRRLEIDVDTAVHWHAQCFAFVAPHAALFSRQNFALKGRRLIQTKEAFSNWPLNLPAMNKEARHAIHWQNGLLNSMGF